MVLRKILAFAAMGVLVALAVFIGSELRSNIASAQDGKEFTADFRLEDCKFTTDAQNPYFILEPRYQLLLEGKEGNEEIRVVITVLNEMEEINLDGIGKIETSVVEEREWVDGELAEISRNFFAVCQQTNSVFYFGENVDIYEDGEIVGHEGAWRTGEGGAVPGIIMPGTFLLGSRYFQEQAPNVAMDRAEHVAMGLQVNVPAGSFADCVHVVETTPLEPGSESVKRYCPGVGLVFDSGVELKNFGTDIIDLDDNEDEDDQGNN